MRSAVLALGAAVLLLAQPAGGVAREGVAVVGLDMITALNSAREVGIIDQCVSVEVGATAAIDVAVAAPGIPRDRGASAYQFRLFYEPSVVSVAADDHEMLLDQAAGSALIPFSDGIPDADGVYTSGAVDFGRRGIEPAGASETGPGVLARLLLSARSQGVSPLVIRDVKLKDDGGEGIEIASVLSAYLYAGLPCPGSVEAPAPGAPAALSSPTPLPALSGAASTADTRTAESGPAALGSAGGPPGDGRSVPWLWIGAGASVAGLAMIAAALRRARG